MSYRASPEAAFNQGPAGVRVREPLGAHSQPAALEFGRRGDTNIKGPTTWNGVQVYERLNRDKLQLFAIRDDRTGLGRVFDAAARRGFSDSERCEQIRRQLVTTLASSTRHEVQT